MNDRIPDVYSVARHFKSLLNPTLHLGTLTLLLVALGAQSAAAQVVVFSPHPIDEALMASGVIARAKQDGKSVKVVVATNGDCESATIGQVREQETVAAMGLLGVPPEDVIFLGYPDCGLRELYYYYQTPGSQFTSAVGFTRTYAYEGLGQTDYHRYMYGASANYSSYALIQDLTTVLRNYNPQDIYTVTNWDDRLDHYSFNFLLSEAVVALVRSSASFQPTVHEAFINAPCELCDPDYHWPMPTFTPTVNVPAPPYLATTPLAWSEVESVEVPAAMQATSPAANLKYQAISQYASQMGAGSWLLSFVKRNEIFWKWELWANLGLRATATASSQAGTGTTADRVNDGAVVGFPIVASVGRGGKGEWVSTELTGAWVQLTWDSAQVISRLVIHDRPTTTENISSGTLTFSDGSSLPVSGLPSNGVGLTLTFPNKSVTWVRFTATAATGTTAGLSEIEVYGPASSKLPWALPPANTAPSITTGPSAAPVTIDDISTSALSVSGFDADGDALIYTWTTTGGRIDGSGANVTFVPPLITTAATYRVDVFAADGRGGIASGWVEIAVTPSDAPHNIGPTATATASSTVNNVNAQTPAKAIDGVVDGYPTNSNKEWASAGELGGAWLQLTWAAPQTISRSVLHDRINTADQILSATLRFSDGTSMAIGALPNDGAGLVTDFAVKTVTWVRLEISAARGGATGLAEWEIISSSQAPGSNVAPQITGGPAAAPASITDAQTSSLSVAAADGDGDTLTYSWQAAGGSISGSGATVTFIPPHVTSATTIRVDVQVSDGHGGSASGFVDVSLTPANTELNIAAFAAVAASAENSSRGQDAVKAVDGVVDGYPTDVTREWAAPGQQAGAWIQLTWSTAQDVARVVVHDRINTSDQILSGTLLFSDGSSVPFGSLPNDGAALSVEFGPKSVTWVRLQVVTARGDNTGLAELEMYGPSGVVNTAPQIVTAPFATPATITDIETTTIALSAVDADGHALTYAWLVNGGTVTGTGSSVTFTPPRIVTETTYHILVTVNDGHGGSTSSSVDVLVHPSSTAVDLAMSAAVTASSENSSRGQDASKAIDGTASGYPVNPTAEWASVGQLAGAWIQLDWGAAQDISRVILHDRINSEDQILGATIAFSDGSTLTVGALTNDGAGVQIDFPPRSVTWMRVTISSSRGSNTGLAELEVY